MITDDEIKAREESPPCAPIRKVSCKEKIENRVDKYGQNIRIVCRCGLKTNWHTEYWMAEKALYDLHADKFHNPQFYN